ncbi:ABC transporter ATP-binding protein [Candidatus Bathyarchaeota archaeon]|nr:ABC transporter ATP-binding protein [Candidatus Bathyarchaeota archaeon]
MREVFPEMALWHRGPPLYVGEVKFERKIPTRILLLRLLKYITPYKREVTLTLIAIIASSISNMISPYILGREIIAKYILRADLAGLQIVILVFLGFLVLGWIANMVRTYLVGKIGENMLFQMRSELFNHLQTLSFSFFDRWNIGDIVSRVTNDTDSIGEAFTEGVIHVLSDIMSLTLVIGMMLAVNVQLTLASMVTIPLLIVSTLIFQSKFRTVFRVTREKISQVTSKLEESLSGIREIKSFNKERDFIEDFQKVNLETMQANIRAAKIQGAFFPTVQVIQAIGSGIVMIYGGILAFNGALGSIEDAVGTLVTFLLYVQTFFRPIQELTNFYAIIQSALAAAERIFELLDIQPEVKDSENAIEMPPIKGEITFENVTFGYDPNHPVVNNISFKINPKETIALVGPTGAGKSTIVKLLCRFYDPQQGSIKIDGYDIRMFTQKSLRKQMGIILQETLLFSGTIKDNIRYGKPDATDEEVINAAKAVGAHEFIMNLPNGYETKVGEKGLGLSFGQKQLIAFARAILKDPAILIMDEATSSIDPYTDLLIRKAMRTLLKDRTAIIIAHRLSTVRDADRILVINNGRIVEEGSHEELIKRKGLYYRLYQMQFKDVESLSKPVIGNEEISSISRK